MVYFHFRKKILFLLLAIWGQLSWVFASECPGVRDTIRNIEIKLSEVSNDLLSKRKFFAFGNKKNPITFSFEVEFNITESPRLLNYYKPPEYTEVDWFKIPIEKRVEIVQDKLHKKLIPKSKILETTSNAPEFLSPLIITAEGGNIEAAANKITDDLEELMKNAQWIDDNIGKGSFQGHAVFNIEKDKNLMPLLGEIKFNSDIAQAESLEKSFEASLKNGKVPAANFVHPYLSPLDEESIVITGSRLEKNSKQATNYRTKRVYGTSYRPDLYGKGKIGFEIRNCHMRIDCIEHELSQLALSIENSQKMPPLAMEKLGDSISPELLGKVSRDNERSLLYLANFIPGNQGQQLKAARFLYPLIAWERHPLILSLPHKRLQQFMIKLEEARGNFKLDLHKLLLPENTISEEQKINELRKLVAKFSSESDLASFLKEGRLTSELPISLVQKFDLPKETIHLLSNVPNPEKAAENLKKIISMESDYNKEQMLYFYASSSLNPEDVMTILSTIDDRALKVFLTEKNSNALFTGLEKLPTQLRKKIISMINYLAKNYPEGINNFIEIIPEIGTINNFKSRLIKAIEFLGEEKVAQSMSSPFFKLEVLSSGLLKEQDYLSYIDLFSQHPKAESLKWFWNNSKDVLRKWGKEYNSLVIARSSKIVPIDSSRYLITIDGEVRFFDIADDATFELKAIGQDKMNKLLEDKKIYESNIKKTVTFNDYQELALRINAKESKVCLLSTGNHSALLVNGFVYEINTDGFIRKLPYDLWIERWGDKRSEMFVAEFKASSENLKKLDNEIDSMIAKKHNFNLHTTGLLGDTNCAHFAANLLNKSGVAHFSPVSFCSMAAGSQAVYIANEAYKSPAVTTVYLKSGSKEAIKSRKNVELATKIGIGVAATASAATLGYVLAD